MEKMAVNGDLSLSATEWGYTPQLHQDLPEHMGY
jgi:hypothetical protein